MMDDEHKKASIRRLKKMAARLNRERYAAGIGVSRRQFTPCAKSLLYLAATVPSGACLPPALEGLGVNDTTPLSQVRAWAAMTICECHSHATADDLLRWEYDSPSPGEEE